VWTQLLLTADVIFCTLASAGGAVLKKTSRIHDLIVDEAAAATEPELCIPFHLKPNRLLAVGDPLQLPATVLSRKAIDLGLTKSLHERLMYECNFEHIMLNVQYRMNAEISCFPSARFYDSKIGNGPNVAGPHYMNGPRLLDRLPYTFLQMDGMEEQSFGGSYSNRSEAKKIVELVTDLQRMALPHERSSWHSTDRIRIITFYQAQVALIKRLLREKGLGDKIVVATVDSSQGCEADIVLISFVRSQSNSLDRHTAGFLTDDRRMNVALTRAKYQLVCVGNVRNFKRMVGATTLHLLADDVEKRSVVRSPLAVRNVPNHNYSSPQEVNTRLDMFYGDGGGGQPVAKKPRFG
jgi:superfamily I DNA and/or RNA helicase